MMIDERYRLPRAELASDSELLDQLDSLNLPEYLRRWPRALIKTDYNFKGLVRQLFGLVPEEKPAMEQKVIVYLEHVVSSRVEDSFKLWEIPSKDLELVKKYKHNFVTELSNIAFLMTVERFNTNEVSEDINGLLRKAKKFAAEARAAERGFKPDYDAVLAEARLLAQQMSQSSGIDKAQLSFLTDLGHLRRQISRLGKEEQARLITEIGRAAHRGNKSIYKPGYGYLRRLLK